MENIKGASVKLLIYSEIKPIAIQINDKSFNSWKYSDLLNMIELNLDFKTGGKKKVKIQK